MLYRQPTTTDIDMDIVPMSITVCHTNGAFYDVVSPDLTESNVYNIIEEPTACGKADDNAYDLLSNENEYEGSVYLQPNVSPTVTNDCPDNDYLHTKEVPANTDEDDGSEYIHTNELPSNTADHGGNEYIHTLESPAVTSEQGGNEYTPESPAITDEHDDSEYMHTVESPRSSMYTYQPLQYDEGTEV